MKTTVKTKTKSITNTQIGVATLAMLLSTAASFAVVPINNTSASIANVQCSPTQVEYSIPCQKRVSGQLVGGYKHAHYVCPGAPDQTGFNLVASCMTVDQLSVLIRSNCERKNQCAVVSPPEQRPQIRVSVDADTPLASNMVFGDIDRLVARFDLTNTGPEDISLRQLVVSFNIAQNIPVALDLLKNIRLFDEQGVEIGQGVARPVRPQMNSSYENVPFSNLNYILPRNTTRRIMVKVDTVPYEMLQASGIRFQAAILTGDIDSESVGTQLALEGVGVNSGNALQSGDLTFVPNDGTIALGSLSEGNRSPLLNNLNTHFVRANEFVTYRSKLAISWAGDTPSGMSNPSAEQKIGKFVVSNAINGGDYSLTLKYLNVSLASTISNTQDRVLKIYKDSLNTQPLATTNFVARFASRPVESFGNTGFSDQDVADVEIASGLQKAFFVTLDTTEATVNKTLSLSIPSTQTARYGNRNGSTVYGIVWSDGVIQDIVAHDNFLPLNFKTLAY